MNRVGQLWTTYPGDTEVCRASDSFVKGWGDGHRYVHALP